MNAGARRCHYFALLVIQPQLPEAGASEPDDRGHAILDRRYPRQVHPRTPESLKSDLAKAIPIARCRGFQPPGKWAS
jgi:hypothetical protein